MKRILLITILLCNYISIAQNEAANWYFGNNAGINFNTNTNAVTALTDGLLSTEEGCTSISDSTGNLLFYTNGENVYDREHNIMPNGTGLFGNQSSTQSAIIIPKPEDPNLYYIFTQDTNFQLNPDNGFNYSIVDMTLNGGFGAVTTKNQFLLNKASEKVTAVLKDCQSQNIWVVTYADSDALTNINAVDNNNNTFYAFEVSAASGVNPTPIVSTLPFSISERRGYLKFSPDGTKLACANVAEGLYLFDFDTTTGIVSNSQQINTTIAPPGQPQSPYGIEFSPDNQVLYVTTYYETPSADFTNPSAQYGTLIQYDLTNTNISATEQVLDQRIMYRSALQLGPDGKIYRSLSATYDQGTPFLSVINTPNNLGVSSDYQHAIINLNGRSSRQGLPPFIASFFSEKIDIIPTDTTNTINLPLCTGDDYTLIAEAISGATYTWTKDDIAIPTPTIPNELLITENGNYEVLIELNTGDCDTKEGQAIVTYFDIPVATQPNDLSICDDNNDLITTFTLSIQDATILNGQNSATYSVQYYLTQADANLDQNQLANLYSNSNPQETIFARVFNSLNSNCYDTTSFNIAVFNTPTIGLLTDYSTCDDTSDGDDTNGQTTIDLSYYNSEVYGSQSAMTYAISYHHLQADANLGDNPLPNNYYNTTPFNETIFVRLENVNNTACFNTQSFNININPAPLSFDEILLQCDQDGIPDGLTIFNLNQITTNITNNAPNVATAFYTTMANAVSETTPIDGNAYSNVTNPQTIYSVVTNTITSCKSISELILEVSATQTNNYIAPPVCDELGSEDGINTFNLDDFSTEILSGLPTGITINYYQTYNDALIEANALPTLYNNTTAYSQIIYARAENDNACYGINEVLLTINPLPQLSENETLFYCLNEFPSTIQLTASTPVNNNYYYNWSTNETTATIDINTTGTYTVTATTLDGCQKTKTIIVEASNTATIENIEVIDGSLNSNVVAVIASGEGDYLFELLNSENMSTGFQSSNIFTNVKPGIYTVNVKDIKNNCGIVTQLFSVVGFPLYFTPNNDGQNDFWQVYGVSNQFQPNSVIQIFDRYGKLLNQFTPSSQGWDGTFNGLPMPTNDYWFTVKLQDGRVYKDHFTLKR
ncbi:T9SS type B sorting domain-containing protein [Olleya sp. HaHaR_3_96]|uniref:T9SS type B sorting domain-containing protein n=1 Tax=Olleya sp. HaHaR_3_96 TaxID=2745560 RepID=UPI001C4F2782|nr:T9SS type B sorting domain-containing protein [Olleya sp. HaHaR_3_96]QXP61489.1 T9SS type B sorting domain-containing protein [Olleya sp. HaHaR_3_96]